jgi:hypothetical protein
MPTPRVLLVANRTATNAALIEAVRARALRGPVDLHLVMPATAQTGRVEGDLAEAA